MHTRAIPSTGALLPVVGCGTWLGFDVGTKPLELASRGEVLATLFAAGGSVVDSSPM
jgi:aryl-alcohol dehydrogenase-like predicted oxidoreductase